MRIRGTLENRLSNLPRHTLHLNTTHLLIGALGIMLSGTSLAEQAPLLHQNTHSTSAAVASASEANQVLKATLSNGLRVVIVKDTLAPVVTTQMNYLVGSDEAPEGFPGTAHATEHMMFRGSPGISQDQIAALAANMGGSYNANTTNSMTQYYFTTPSQNLDVALHLEALRMRGLDATDAQWKDERGAIEQEVSRDLSNPGFKFYTQLVANMFKGTPYAHTPLGTRESFDKTPASMIRRFHDQWYAPNNAVLVIAGDVDPQKTLAMVKSRFGDIPHKTLPARPSFNFQPFKPYSQTLPTDSPYGTVALNYRWPGIHSKDYYAALILSSVLSSQRGDLYALGVNGTALQAGFNYSPLAEAGNATAEGIFSRGSDPKPVLAAIKKIMTQASTNGVDPKLIEAAKRNLVSSFEFQRNSISGLANLWSSILGKFELDNPEQLIQRINAVTPEQVNAAAKRLLNPDHAATVTLLPQSSGAATSSKGYGGTENFSATPNKAVQLPEWARKSFDKLEVPHSTLHPVTYDLPNGIHLIVQPENLSNTVQVYGSINTNEDMQSPKHQEGVADILDGLFQYGGTTQQNRLQYLQSLDNISASVNLGENFGLNVLSSNFEDGMKLLAQGELSPALPAAAFSVLQRQYAGYVAGAIQSPDFLFAQGLSKGLLPTNDPYLRHATPQSFQNLTLNDVRQYYRKVYRPDMTTITIVGKVDPEKARQIVEQTFGSWKANGAKPDVYYPKVPLNKSTSVHVPDSSATQDTVTLSQMVNMTDTSPDRYAFHVGNEILSGGLYASRLYQDLRAKHGLVYNVESSLDLDKNRGSFSVNYGSDPQNVSAAQQLTLRDLQQMQTSLVSESDLKRAQGMMIRQIPLSESSYGAILSQLTALSQNGKPLNQSTISAQNILKVTPEAIRQAFKDHIRLDGFVRAVQGPPPK